jgi:hypothetical protein
MRKNVTEALKHLRRAKELAARIKSPFAGLTMDKAVAKIRKAREELWEEKLAAGLRHK